MADTIIRPEPITQISPTAVRWTRDDCAALERAGVLNYRYELVEGVINRMSQNLRHANLVRLLIGWLVAAFGMDFFFTQTTIDVRPEDNPTSAPEPDAVVLNCKAGELTHIPTPADISFLIEASDTTLAYDLTIKAGLYARAGIAEYWVVNLPDRQLHVHREPVGGQYRAVRIVGETESVSPLAAPEALVEVSRLLPPAVTVERQP